MERDIDIQDTVALVLAERGPLTVAELWPSLVATYPALAQRYNRRLVGLARILMRDRAQRFRNDQKTREWHLVGADEA